MKLKIPFLLILLWLVSCKTVKPETDLRYLKDSENEATIAAQKYTVNTLQSGDQLGILVSAKDLDVVKPFNQNYSSGEMVQNVQAGGNVVNQVPAATMPTYLVDSNGEIDFPVVGKLAASGKTLEEFQNELRSKLTRYIINPTVTVRHTNYKITVLGEVNRPGEYTITDGRATILNALGLAGDLTMYGRRNDVLIVRNDHGIISKERINLADSNFINSPYFQLKQGDVIYVSPNENRQITARQNPNTGLYITIASVALGVLGLLVTVFKK